MAGGQAFLDQTRTERPVRACLTHLDGLLILVVTVHRAHGFTIVIFVDDHEPAHVPCVH